MTSEPTDSSSPAAVPRSGAGLRPLEWARAAGAEAIVEREMRAGVRRRRQRRARALGAAVLAIAIPEHDARSLRSPSYLGLLARLPNRSRTPA